MILVLLIIIAFALIHVSTSLALKLVDTHIKFVTKWTPQTVPITVN